MIIKTGDSRISPQIRGNNEINDFRHEKTRKKKTGVKGVRVVEKLNDDIIIELHKSTLMRFRCLHERGYRMDKHTHKKKGDFGLAPTMPHVLAKRWQQQYNSCSHFHRAIV